MAAHKRVFTPEQIAEAKRLYENTATPTGDIAALLGICKSTLDQRVKEWKWSQRTHIYRSIDLARMVRGAIAADVTDPNAADSGDAPRISPQRRAALALRIQAIVERQMAAVEQIVEMIGPSNRGDAESAVRMLAGISRTLREAAALNQPDNGTLPDDTDDDLPCDIDEFRQELARRLEGIIDAERRREREGAGRTEGT